MRADQFVIGCPIINLQTHLKRGRMQVASEERKMTATNSKILARIG